MEGKRVKVHSVLTVVSSVPIEPGRVHRFTAMDHAMGLHTLHVVLYYESNPFGNGSAVDLLRDQLSNLLCSYPSVTGRLARDGAGNWEVKCNDAGVRVLVAKVDSRMDEWLRSADSNAERDLTIREDMPEDPTMWSPFRIQVNEFQCGGLALGLSWPHMHADFTSLTLLLKSWSEAYQAKPVIHPPILHLPSPNIQIPPTPQHLANKSLAQTTPLKMATATFRFSHSAVQKHLSQVHDMFPETTPFDLLAAVFWSRIVQCKKPTNIDQYTLSICVDPREQGPSAMIPYGYFGNAIHFSPLTIKAGEVLGGDELGSLAGQIHQHVAGIKGECFWSDLKGFESHKGGKYAAPFRMYGAELTCLSMEHMMVSEGLNGCNSTQPLIYSVVFKDGQRPVHVSYHVGNVGGQGLIMVMPSPEGGFSRTVAVTLPEEEIAKLCADQEIRGLEPIMLLSGNQDFRIETSLGYTDKAW